MIDPDSNNSAKLIEIAKSGITYLEQYRKLSNEGKFEVILFNSLAVLNYYKEKHPARYSETEDEYFSNIFYVHQDFNIPIELNDLSEFINGRFILYSEELSKLYGGIGYMPLIIFNLFYENPLKPTPTMSMDATQTILFYRALIEMMNHINNSLDEIL